MKKGKYKLNFPLTIYPKYQYDVTIIVNSLTLKPDFYLISKFQKVGANTFSNRFSPNYIVFHELFIQDLSKLVVTHNNIHKRYTLWQ